MARYILYATLILAAIFFTQSSKAHIRSLVEFKITTDKVYKFYLPADRNVTHVLKTDDGIECIIAIKYRKFVRLMCDKGFERLVVFEERSPELKTTIMASDILIEINGIQENK